MTPFFTQLNIIAFMWIGYSITFLQKYIRQWKLPEVITFALIVFQLFHNFTLNDEHSTDVYEQYGNAILSPLPTNSVLIVRGDLPYSTVVSCRQLEIILEFYHRYNGKACQSKGYKGSA
jgi:hypothetical protein